MQGSRRRFGRSGRTTTSSAPCRRSGRAPAPQPQWSGEPEQAPDVQSEFVRQKVPLAPFAQASFTQLPLRHCPLPAGPGSQNLPAAHGAAEVHVLGAHLYGVAPVSVQTPEAQSLAVQHVAPGPGAAGAHVPLTQLPEQQSPFPAQTVPTVQCAPAAQVRAVHLLDADWPEPQSAAALQLIPQALPPTPSRHVLLTQLPETHSELPVAPVSQNDPIGHVPFTTQARPPHVFVGVPLQMSEPQPAAPQQAAPPLPATQTLAVQVPEQHWAFPRGAAPVSQKLPTGHVAPVPHAGGPHLGPAQTPERQSAGAAQMPPVPTATHTLPTQLPLLQSPLPLQ